MIFTFKNTKSLEDRKREAQLILTKHPGLLPIVLERSARSRLPSFERSKVLSKASSTVGQFLQYVRSHLRLPGSQVIFLFINGRDLVSNDMMTSELYDSHKDEDGFLYIMYSEQEVLGNF
jgi:hypothetical protein